jgi:acyl-coenzyme A synthetase/AMP-(fatty) acid ligase
MQSHGLSVEVEAACRRHRDQIATWQPDGSPVTFANYFATIAAFAERLDDAGVVPGAKVSIEIKDGLAGRMLTLAVMRLGATVLPNLAAFPWITADLRLARRPDPARPGPVLAVTPDWIRSPRRLVPVAGGGCLVKATSGTTGLPKLRMLDENCLAARLTRSVEMRGTPDRGVFIGYNPGSSPGFNNGMRALLAGTAQLNQPATPSLWLAAMRQHGISLACLPPWNFEQLLAAAEAEGTGGLQLSEIRVGGGPVSHMLARRGEALFGCPVVNTFGSNEAGSIAHHRPALDPGERGIVGATYPDLDLRFLGPDGALAEPAAGGELWLKLPPVLRVRDYPSDQALCDAEGWQGTGDLARLLPDGRLQLLGRVSEVLNVGGNKVAPVRIEIMTEGFPGLNRIAVFRAPSETGMDHVGLAVVPGSGFDATGFLAYMAERLGPRYPLVLRILDQLPVTEAGKIDRAGLTKSHEAETGH